MPSVALVARVVAGLLIAVLWSSADHLARRYLWQEDEGLTVTAAFCSRVRRPCGRARHPNCVVDRRRPFTTVCAPHPKPQQWTCHTTLHIQPQGRPPFICAHGGDVTRHPPNTHPAIAAAPRFGADCIELDASTTADGRLVAMHARDLRRLLPRAAATGGGPAGEAAAASPADLRLEQLLSLSWPGAERPLELEAALAAALASRSIELVILDLKDDDATSAAELLRTAQAAGCGHGRCLIWGKSDSAMLEVKRLAPQQVRPHCQGAARSPHNRGGASKHAAACFKLARLQRAAWRHASSAALSQSAAASRMTFLVVHATPCNRLQAAGYVVMAHPGAAASASRPLPPAPEYAPLRLPGMAVAGAWHGVLDAGLVARLRRGGQKVIAWTLEDPGDLGRVLDLGASASGMGGGCLGGTWARLQCVAARRLHSVRVPGPCVQVNAK
jgi:glycerophosphoryl diester phosphodiesterase